MKEATTENISALVDGELTGHEARELADRLASDAASKMCWQHYHLISDALRNNLPDTVAIDLAAKVSTALESEPQLDSLALSQPATSMLKPLAGFALAASVAAVAYLGLSTQTETAAPALPSVAANMPAKNHLAVTPGYRVVRGANWDIARPTVESKLNDYLANHNEYATSMGPALGMMPQVRLVGYDQAETGK